MEDLKDSKQTPEGVVEGTEEDTQLLKEGPPVEPPPRKYSLPIQPEDPPVEEPPRRSSLPPKPKEAPPKTSTSPPKPEEGPPKTSSSPPKPEEGPPKTSTSPPKPEEGPPKTSTSPPKPEEGPLKTSTSLPKPEEGPPKTSTSLPKPEEGPLRRSSLPPNPQEIPPKPKERLKKKLSLPPRNKEPPVEAPLKKFSMPLNLSPNPPDGPPGKPSSNTELHKAIAEQDLDGCLRLLRDETNINALDERDGSTPLHILPRKKWLDGCVVATRLLAKGAKVNAKDHAEHTPLHIAAREGRIELCELLLAYHRETGKLNLNMRRKTNLWTPLHYAAQEGQSQVVELLLQEGADPKLPDKKKWLPLHHAANKGYKDCCRLLAASYTHSGALDVPPPFALAAFKGYYKCCKELVCDDNSLWYCDGAGNTPLHVVARKGFNVLVEFLLDSGAPLDVPNSSGNTPLMEAVRNNKLQCMKLLAERGASLVKRNNEHSTVLHLAAACRAHKCLEYLLNCKGIEHLLNVKDGNDLSALSVAAKKCDETSFGLLIQAGASPSCRPGESLLHFRPVYRRPKILDMMLSYDGPNVNFSDDKGVTPLHLAAEEGSKVACSLLLHRGARINALDNCGRTPLYMGAAAGHFEVLRLLLTNGALLRAKEYKTKFTALHAAAAAGSRECCKILLDADSGLGSEHNDANKYALDVAYEHGHHGIVGLLLENFKSLPKDLKLRLHDYTHKSIQAEDRVFVEEIFSSKWWEVGCGLDRSLEEAPCSNFRDIIQPFPKIACNIMTKCRRGSINDFQLLENIPYLQNREWDGARRRGGSILEEHPVGVMVNCERLGLLQHPLVESWINYKWCSYARWLFMGLLLQRLLTVVALLSFLLYTTNWTQIKTKYNLTEQEVCGDFYGKDEFREEEAAPWTLSATLKAYLVHVLLAVFLLQQLCMDAICLRKTKMMHNEEILLLRLPSLVLSLVALFPTSVCERHYGIKSVFAWECGIVALLLVWFDLIHNINKLPQFTVFPTVNVNFLKGYLKGLMYIGMVVLMFSFAFHLLLNDQISFSTVPLSMVQVVVWMVGDLNYDDNFLNPTLDYPLLSISLFLLFVCTVGAFFVTLLKTPSSDKKKLRYYKQTGRVYLLLKIDICFPWFRNLCLAYKHDEKEKIPHLFVKILEYLRSDGDSPGPSAPPNGMDVVDRTTQKPFEIILGYCEDFANFFDNDDDESDDEGCQKVHLGLLKKILDEHTQQLENLTSRFDLLLQCCEEREDIAQGFKAMSRRGSTQNKNKNVEEKEKEKV